uniref:Disease resistance protein At4g27190-like leucine-rich repeats domain-containing protein n=1 Tax=Brassica campestris TaxID=3711 RepID=M4DTA8_BRACM
MEHLEVVTIDTFSTSALEELLRSHKLENSVQRLSIVEAKNNLVLSATDDLIDLTVTSCSTLKVDIKMSSSRRSFDNLSAVCISSCDGLQELTWLLFAPNLTFLELKGLKKLQEIMNREKAAAQQLQGEATLRKLETLNLSDLPVLKQIYWSTLPFPCLESIKVRNCPKLKKLSLDSKSCGLGKTFTIQCNDENWIKSIQWKDQATKARFKSCCLQSVSSLLELARFRLCYSEWLYNLVVKYIQSVIISELQEKSFRVLTLPAMALFAHGLELWNDGDKISLRLHASQT